MIIHDYPQLWLFKPNMRLSYSSPTSTLIPRSGSVMAAKILFKIIGPGGTLAYDMKTSVLVPLVFYALTAYL